MIVLLLFGFMCIWGLFVFVIVNGYLFKMNSLKLVFTSV